MAVWEHNVSGNARHSWYASKWRHFTRSYPGTMFVTTPYTVGRHTALVGSLWVFLMIPHRPSIPQGAHSSLFSSGTNSLSSEMLMYLGRMIFPDAISSSILCALHPTALATANMGVNSAFGIPSMS